MWELLTAVTTIDLFTEVHTARLWSPNLRLLQWIFTDRQAGQLIILVSYLKIRSSQFNATMITDINAQAFISHVMFINYWYWMRKSMTIFYKGWCVFRMLSVIIKCETSVRNATFIEPKSALFWSEKQWEKTEEKIFSQGDARISNVFSYQCNQED